MNQSNKAQTETLLEFGELTKTRKTSIHLEIGKKEKPHNSGIPEIRGALKLLRLEVARSLIHSAASVIFFIRLERDSRKD
jgi:hypothetical protein